MRSVPRNRREPSVQEVVGLLEETSIVGSHRLHRFRSRLLQLPHVIAEQHDGQRAQAEEVPIDLEFGQRIAELIHRRRRGVIDEHLLGFRFWRDVIHE